MKYFLVAGEASGDMHAAALITQLKQLDDKAQFCFLGGDLMRQAASSEPLVHIKDMAFMGFINVIKNAGKIKKIHDIACQALSNFAPDQLILIDYPGFNLRFAEYVKKNAPAVCVNYYISPKLWAWKSYRIKAIKSYVDRMFTIFPFETQYFKDRNYEVHYVGNPSVDAVAEYNKKPFDEASFRERNKLDSRPVIALLPGSRLQEVKGCLQKMVQVAPQFPDYQFVVAMAPARTEQDYDFLDGKEVRLVKDSTYSLLKIATAAVVNSGTATLETALFKVPQVVVYNVFGVQLALMLKDIVIKTKHVSLVNIIAQKEVVKELLASDFTVENIISQLDMILHDADYRDKILTGYNEIISQLGEAGAAKRCAQEIVKK